jgi:hypothetical protein
MLSFNHEELNRDYAGYCFVQEEMEMVIKRFLELYYDEILLSYYDGEGAKIEYLQVDAAGAGASKFVFGVFGKTANGQIPLIFGIRMYNNIGKMRDEEQLYDSANKYQVTLETYDQKLAEVLVDELKVYQEFKELAKTSINITKIWIRFLPSEKLIENQYVNRFTYIEDHELKRLMVNLGINAITVGDFVVGYDGKKILGRDEFSLAEKINAIVHISNTLLQTWLLTLRYNNQHELIGRTIVDLKPAQFIIQSDQMQKEEWMPAVIIDVGPAENTDNIYTYFKTVSYMRKLIPAFATEMLKKLALPENEHQNTKRIIYDNLNAHLDNFQNNHHYLHDNIFLFENKTIT